jgi:recombination protein RecA
MMTTSTRKKRTTDQQDYLSTGSTVLNLACTGDPNAGFRKGLYFFLVGDSKSGKTFLSLTCLAEAARNKAFDGYRFIFDDVEGGALMDIACFFGKKVAQRLEVIRSGTIEDFYFNLDDALKGKQPVIYVLDSMDALSSDASIAKFDERKIASRGGKEATGSYGDGKAGWNSENIRAIMAQVRDTGSILLVVNQTRDNVGANFWEPKQTRGGGRSLTFYATLELWSSVGKAIKRSVKGKDRVIGVHSRVTVKKNRFTGRQTTVNIPIYFSYGIDDLGGSIAWLVEEGFWKSTKQGIITATGLGPEFKGRRDDIAAHIEEGDLYEELNLLLMKSWKEIDEKCALKRASRYS